MDVATFLKSVVTGTSGWFCLAHAKIRDDEKGTKESWKEEFFSWPDELSAIINRIRVLGEEYDVYFSPYLFKEQSSTKANSIVGRTIVADLDEANILTLQLKPTILVQTSPGRHQGYWILRDELDNEEHEKLSRRLTYSIPRCDRTGWFIGKKVRVPETYNHKYKIGPQYIRVVDDTGRIYNNSEFDDISSENELFGEKIPEIDEEDLDWAEAALVQDVGPQEMLARIRASVPTVAARYNLVSQDRSATLWGMYLALFRAGLSRDKVFFIAYHSPNNKFKELRFGGIRELAKDVLRAELANKIQLPDIKSTIRGARQLGENPSERSEYISRLIKDYLGKIGTFIHCNDDSLWYIRDDTGRPIHLNVRSEPLQRMIDNLFGVNASERESNYIAHSLESMASELPITGKVATLSYYEHHARTFILHTGRKDVLIVTAENIRRETNGYGGIIFRWNVGNNAISPNYSALDVPWEDELFDDCLNNVLSLKKEDAKAILKVWFISVLLRDGLSSRPILALFGMPGSGKSTLFRRIYALIYGRERGLNSVTKEDDFDHAMSQDPLVVLDNVDTYAKWLPDRLAATIAPTEITRRKLFTDTDTITVKRNAMLGITAHNPKFGREDVTDRLLLFTFERLDHFKPETTILDRITQMRNALWASILTDIQKVMGADMPRSGYPQFRIEDFAQYGYWIATALGIGSQFVRGINTIRNEQRSFNLEEDLILLTAIERMLDREAIVNMGAGQLWMKLKRYSTDERGFDKRYVNSVSLGKKLWNLVDSLKEVYNIEWEMNKGMRVWNISKKEVEVGTNGVAH